MAEVRQRANVIGETMRVSNGDTRWWREREGSLIVEWTCGDTFEFEDETLGQVIDRLAALPTGLPYCAVSLVGVESSGLLDRCVLRLGSDGLVDVTNYSDLMCRVELAELQRAVRAALALPVPTAAIQS